MANDKKRALAQGILRAVGEKENITGLMNCMTRVRLNLRDGQAADFDALKKLDGVLGVVNQDNYLQIILGPGVAAAVAELMSGITGIPVENVDEAVMQKDAARIRNDKPLQRSLKKVASIFMPIIPAFIACGLLVAVYEASYVAFPTLPDSSLGKILSAVAYSVFAILPILVGYNTSKEFGGTPVIGAVLAAVMTSANLSGAEIFGMPITPGRGGIISVLLLAACACYVEKFLRKFIPDALDLFLTPLFTIGIMTVAGLAIVQPLGGLISEGIGTLVSFLIYKIPALAGVATALYLPLVVTGMHHGLIAVNTQLITDFGVTYLLPVTAMAGQAQVGAAIAVYLRTKNKRLKKTIRNALPIGMLGIGEPLIWGVTIPLGKPFLASCLGGGVAGSVMALMKVAAKVPELGGLPLGFITTRFPLYFVGVLVAYAAGFIICNIMGFTDPPEEA